MIMGNNWFVWSDEDHFEWFQTQAEAIARADMLVVDYFDGTIWDESVESIKVGQMTHKVVEINRIERPPVEILEDSSWGDLEYKCDYQVRGIDTLVEMLIVKVSVFVRPTDDSHCLYEAYRSPYGQRAKSPYQIGDRFIIKQERIDAVVAIDPQDDWILIPHSELSCFDRVKEENING
jgi:hypothetical protein